MAFYKKTDLVNESTPEVFFGTFEYEIEGDPTSPLVYRVPSGKQGDVTIQTQLRYSDTGLEITNEAGATIQPTAAATVVVEGGTPSVDPDNVVNGSQTFGTWSATSGHDSQFLEDGKTVDSVGADMLPVAHWVEPGWMVHPVGDVVTVELAADHLFGIKTVEVSANNGDFTPITTKNSSGHYVFDVTVGTEDIELRAKITPNKCGKVRILQDNRATVGAADPLSPDIALSAWQNSGDYNSITSRQLETNIPSYVSGVTDTKDYNEFITNTSRPFVIFSEANHTITTHNITNIGELKTALSGATASAQHEFILGAGTFDLNEFDGDAATVFRSLPYWWIIKGAGDSTILTRTPEADGTQSAVNWTAMNNLLSVQDLKIDLTSGVSKTLVKEIATYYVLKFYDNLGEEVIAPEGTSDPDWADQTWLDDNNIVKIITNEDSMNTSRNALMGSKTGLLGFKLERPSVGGAWDKTLYCEVFDPTLSYWDTSNPLPTAWVNMATGGASYPSLDDMVDNKNNSNSSGFVDPYFDKAWDMWNNVGEWAGDGVIDTYTIYDASSEGTAKFTFNIQDGLTNGTVVDQERSVTLASSEDEVKDLVFEGTTDRGSGASYLGKRPIWHELTEVPVPDSDAIFTVSNYSGSNDQNSAKLFHKGITFDGDGVWSEGTKSSGGIFDDNWGSYPQPNPKYYTIDYQMKFETGSQAIWGVDLTAQNTTYQVGTNGGVGCKPAFATRCNYGNTGGDIYSQCLLVSDCSISNLNGVGSSLHTDVWQVGAKGSGTNARSDTMLSQNLYVNKLNAYFNNNGSGQGVFMKGNSDTHFLGTIIRDSEIKNSSGGIKVEKNDGALFHNFWVLDSNAHPGGNVFAVEGWDNVDGAIVAGAGNPPANIGYKGTNGAINTIAQTGEIYTDSPYIFGNNASYAAGDVSGGLNPNAVVQDPLVAWMNEGYSPNTVVEDKSYALPYWGPDNFYALSSVDDFETVQQSDGVEDPTWATEPSLGIPQVGTETTITNGTATSPGSHNPVTQTYEWRRDGVAISGATAATYTPVPADAGTTLSVYIQATNSVGDITSRTAEAPDVTLPAASSVWEFNASTTGYFTNGTIDGRTIDYGCTFDTSSSPYLLYDIEAVGYDPGGHVVIKFDGNSNKFDTAFPSVQDGTQLNGVSTGDSGTIAVSGTGWGITGTSGQSRRLTFASTGEDFFNDLDDGATISWVAQ